MCGRLNTTFDSGVKKLYTRLKINKVIDRPIDRRFVKAADTVSIVRNVGEQRRVESAMWWLLLDQTENDFKPSRFTSFNTRFDKLNTPQSAGYQAYRSARCIIAVKGFGETEFVDKKPVHYFDMQAESGGLILGGLYRTWQHNKTGEIKLSCSVITLPAHEKLKHIHSKAMPLILPQNLSLIDKWLDPQCDELNQFEHLLHPRLPQSLIAHQIDRPMTHQPISLPQTIPYD
ncbi:MULTISPECIES: SOS response-associated peptidase family protein [unclassified Colwellia]|uniref:SOS response-associated peptidase family protein n=1 Tax=unclassified Colwellia TaxID=196834 RepID=UPI0015F5CE2C|nr:MULTISPECIES: SOS response-associated peptidase family protein [unclassified Colwellia]MBA6380660.1 SOS response-associated peptidase family protein [Colwellia sp. BRX10-7]MBA6388005.1 SOS response-associated peptidase family protein [Colwellia sp. BRX10-2]MBA6401994.1 SOS response-associated peptidase family protein [Colwellia sp. BRX10-5]MBA6406450.1 SOS response-associated peptidase family protein [Colwellia sp. BRX10-1]